MKCAFSYLKQKMDAIHVVYLIDLMALSSLIFAYCAEYFWGVKPCILCMYQRYMTVSIIFVATLCHVAHFQKKYFKFCYALLICSVLSGVSLSIFHTGVENKWWRGTAGCHGGFSSVSDQKSYDEQFQKFKAMLNKNQQEAIVACDEVNWRIVGLSATVWYAMLQLGWLVLLLFVGFKKQLFSRISPKK